MTYKKQQRHPECNEGSEILHSVQNDGEVFQNDEENKHQQKKKAFAFFFYSVCFG